MQAPILDSVSDRLLPGLRRLGEPLRIGPVALSSSVPLGNRLLSVGRDALIRLVGRVGPGVSRGTPPLDAEGVLLEVVACVLVLSL